MGAEVVNLPRIMTSSSKIAFTLLTVIIEVISALTTIHSANSNKNHIHKSHQYQVSPIQREEEFFLRFLTSNEKATEVDATKIGILPFPHTFRPYQQAQARPKHIEDKAFESTLYLLRTKILDEASRFEAAHTHKPDHQVQSKSATTDNFLIHDQRDELQREQEPDAATLHLLHKVLSKGTSFQ